MIVVVGNGLPGTGNGPRIDSADFIIRCNDAWKTIGGDRGTRTSALCCKTLFDEYREWCQENDVELWDCDKSPLVAEWVGRYGKRFSRGMMAIIMSHEIMAAKLIHVASCEALMTGLPHLGMHYCGKRLKVRHAQHDFETERRLLDDFCREHNVTLEVLHGDPDSARRGCRTDPKHPDG